MKKQKILNRILFATTFVLMTNGTVRAQEVQTIGYSWNKLPAATLPVFKKDTFNIVKFGAVSGPSFLNTKSISDAIDRCSENGGGVVMIPRGDWVTGPVRLKSNINLYLAKGAMLEFSKDKNLYPMVAGNFEGLRTVRNQPPLSGEDLENIAITGEGTIEGNGDVWRPLSRGKQNQAQWAQKIRSGGIVSADGNTWYPSAQSKKGQEMSKSGQIDKLKTVEDFMPIKDYLRPNLLVLTRCKKVLLQDVTFQNSPAWCLHPLMCSDLTIQRVHVNNPAWAQNGDGLDIESCKNVLVEHSTFECGDDGICIKSGKDEQGRSRAMPTENVTVQYDTVYHAHGGFVIGSEMSGGAKNLFVTDCVFDGTDKGLRFKTVRGRGGMVNDIYVRNITMKNIVQEAIYFDMYYFAKPPQSGEKAPVFTVNDGTPRFQDFYISDIRCDGAEKGIFVRGLPEMSIKNINLRNLDLKVKTGVEIIEAENIHLDNLNIHSQKAGPVVFIENSSDVNFNGLSTTPNSDLLFSIAGQRTKNITASGIRSNGLANVAKFDDVDKDVLKIN